MDSLIEILNLKKTSERIKKAIKNNEKIILFADADLDGVCSLIILQESIKCMGGSTNFIYFPDREEEGYGLNSKALETIKKESPALIITLDCGISNFEEIKKAKEIGFSVLIIDHHQVLGHPPKEAEIVVDPKQEKDNYPFKKLANAGIVFYLSKELLGKRNFGLLHHSFIELSAFATIADMMEEIQDNEAIIKDGLATILKSCRPGLKAIMDLFYNPSLTTRQIVQKAISVLNITEFERGVPKSYFLLTNESENQSKKIALGLFEKSQRRYEEISDMTSQANEIILENPQDCNKIIFIGDEDWKQVLTGAVASRICNKFQKPVFIFKKGKDISRGSVRTTKQNDSVQALEACSNFLVMYGGHPQAAGFTLETKNLKGFRNCLENFFSKK